MRLALFLVAFLLVAGCGDRRDFDERFNDTSSEISARAQAIDANLSDAQSAQNAQD
ncbi:hypothetical protein [Sphingomonas arenae]|uniref:hypothetical protein n=1 Tax=Sphingomonas arenae TaxID=2812555 RepID=UPI001966DFED|nr:hypothetical protein [Sphingomonas arenae]